MSLLTLLAALLAFPADAGALSAPDEEAPVAALFSSETVDQWASDRGLASYVYSSAALPLPEPPRGPVICITSPNGGGTVCFDPNFEVPDCVQGSRLDTPLGWISIAASTANTIVTGFQESAAVAATENYSMSLYYHAGQQNGQVVSSSTGVPHEAMYIYHSNWPRSPLPASDERIMAGNRRAWGKTTCEDI